MQRFVICFGKAFIFRVPYEGHSREFSLEKIFAAIGGIVVNDQYFPIDIFHRFHNRPQAKLKEIFNIVVYYDNGEEQGWLNNWGDFNLNGRLIECLPWPVVDALLFKAIKKEQWQWSITNQQ